MTDLGYVVIQFNQASGMPRLADEDIYDTVGEARDRMSFFADRTATVGRRERYAVAELHLVDESEAS